MFRLATQNIVRRARRSLLAILAIAAGVIALVLAGGFIEWGLWFGRESTIHSQLGHIRVFKAGYLDAGLANPFAYLLAPDPKQSQLIESVDGVTLLSPRLSFNGLSSHGESTISFIGEGVEPAHEASLSKSITIVAGQGLSDADPKGIIVGQGLAANLGVKPGDTMVLLVNTASGGINAIEGRVRGLFSTITKAYDDVALRVPITLSRELLRVSGSHSYALLLNKTELTDSVVSKLRARFPDKLLDIVPWWQMADFYNKTAELFSRQLGVVRTIIALIIVLSISNTLMTSVLERTREIGTMMALGAERTAIIRLFLTEGALLGAIGGAAGALAAWIIGLAISAIGIPMPAAPGMASTYRAEVMITWPLTLHAFILATLTALAASVYPAWKASRMRIVDALRHSA